MSVAIWAPCLPEIMVTTITRAWISSRATMASITLMKSSATLMTWAVTSTGFMAEP